VSVLYESYKEKGNGLRAQCLLRKIKKRSEETESFHVVLVLTYVQTSFHRLSDKVQKHFKFPHSSETKV